MFTNHLKRRRDAGFSLVELLVVVVIIGILASIAIPLFTNQKSKGYRASAQSDARAIYQEAESLKGDILSWNSTQSGELDHATKNQAITDTEELRLDVASGSPERVSGTARLSPGSKLVSSKVTPTDTCVIVENNGQYVKFDGQMASSDKSTDLTCP